jgi:EAL domain-containing protein (putative c-di-GMP-specific phosphodiesterase class I)
MWESDRPDHAPGGTVLVVDDQDAVLRAFARVLRRSGYNVLTATDGKSALAIVNEFEVDAVVSDISMPDMDGIALLRAIRDVDCDLPVVLATGEPSIESAADAIEHGALKYLRKPVMPTTLLSAVEDAVHRGRDKRDTMVESNRIKREKAELSASFDQGLAQLWMAFQPIICWSQQRVFGYEALLRTEHEQLRSPLHFIEAAEKLERINTLGRAVRDEIGRRAGETPSDAKIFVNLHPRDLLDEQLFLPTTPLGLVASNVILEVTERASLDELGDVRDAVRRLRELGYRIAIDDLGAGYASLSAIALLEPDVVKLDMTLVRNVDVLPTKQRLVRAMTSLSRELGAMVVAEGVETEAERDCLLGLGCDFLQGWLFARPQREMLSWPK